MTELKIKPGIYEHYKKKYYEVIETARHSETLEDMVFYRMLDDNSLWVRPLTMFVEHIDIQGQRVPRFKFVSSQNHKEFSKSSFI